MPFQPITAASAAATSARPARPFSASGRPSKVVATAVEAPGIPSVTDEIARFPEVRKVQSLSDVVAFRYDAEGDWIEVHARASRVPFEFETRPAIRFILVQAPELSELIILCHHMICDGMSLAYLARDLMMHLGEPDREVAVLPVGRQERLQRVDRSQVEQLADVVDRPVGLDMIDEVRETGRDRWVSGRHTMV